MREQPYRTTRVVVGMTGATGVIYGIRLLEQLQRAHVETHLVMSRWAGRTMIAETSHHPNEVRRLANHVYEEDDLAAPIAQGSFATDGMLVAPCSMKTLAAIANGHLENLIVRAALVTIAEGLKLVLVVRESPLSVIHLENMLHVARGGAMVVPPVPSFYAKPQTIDEMVEHTVGRLLDQFSASSRDSSGGGARSRHQFSRGLKWTGRRVRGLDLRHRGVTGGSPAGSCHLLMIPNSRRINRAVRSMRLESRVAGESTERGRRTTPGTAESRRVCCACFGSVEGCVSRRTSFRPSLTVTSAAR